MNIYRKSDIPPHLQQWFDPVELGLEATPEEYVEKMVGVFREVKRVLRDDGTLWLNLGDSYTSGGRQGHGTRLGYMQQTNPGTIGDIEQKRPEIPTGLKPKDLCGIPWRVAFALQADGWYLRQDIIWAKPNPMPESVTDRCTKAHEYIFLLSKSARYCYDADAIREKASGRTDPITGFGKPSERKDNDRSYCLDAMKGANKRSVWTVATAPYKQAHFATFPPKLIEPCILAGCPEGGVVLDVFHGAGTTGMVAQQNGRRYVGCELNAEYIELSKPRLQQPSLF